MAVLGRAVLGAGSGSSDPPATPVLTLVIADDGSSATATISGTAAGSTNRVYVAIAPGVWELAGTRVGDGDLALTLTIAHHWALVQTTTAGGTASSLPIYFTVPSGAGDFVYTPQRAKLHEMIAATRSFRRHLGLDPDDGATILEAAKHVLPPVAEPELRGILPAIVVEVGDDWRFGADADGARTEMSAASGSFRVIFADKSRSNDFDQDYNLFCAFVGGVLSELMEASSVDDNLSLFDFQQDGEPIACDDVQAAGGLWWLAQWRISWGTGE